VVARLRLDARLFTPPPPRVPGQRGRPRLVGDRLPNLTQAVEDQEAAWIRLTLERWYGEQNRPIEVRSQTAICSSTGFPPVPIRWVLIRDPLQKFRTQALLCTDLTADPLRVISWFVLRWQLEVTFHQVRAHLGMETQRQWAERAIVRATPALLGLFPLVTLLAHERLGTAATSARQSAWYAKSALTFSDALALVRRELWTRTTFCGLPHESDPGKMPHALLDHLTDLLCYAA
jgi:hypothetical protein